jgi:PGF-CTERM protein
MKTSKRGKAITSIALVTIMVASVMVAMVGSAAAAQGGTKYNVITEGAGSQKVLMGQDLEFVGFTGTPTVYRYDAGDQANTYEATVEGDRYFLYNINWPTSGAYYVNVKSVNPIVSEAPLSYEDPDMPLRLRVKDKDVTSLAVGTKLNVDVGGIDLFDLDRVDLEIIGPDGQVSEKNGVKFRNITVSTLKTYGNLDTTGLKVGHYTLQVIIDKPDFACGLSDQSVKKELNIIKSEVTITAATTEVPELETVSLTVTGVAGENITMEIETSSPNAYFPKGIDDNPRTETTRNFFSTIDDDGTMTYAVEFNDTGAYTIRASETDDLATYDNVDITVTDRDVIFDVPSTVVIGERFDVKGTANTGDMITVAVDDEVVQKLDQIVIEEDGEFSEEIDTSALDAPSKFKIPGSVRLKAYIDRAKEPTYPVNVPLIESDDGSVAILMTRGEIRAELSTDDVAESDDFTITGTSAGSQEVAMLIVAPKGYSGSNIETDQNQMYYTSTSVTQTEHTFYKKISVCDDVDNGKYLVMVLSPGSDGVWGKTGYPRLYNPNDIRDPDTALGEYTLDTRTQEEMLEVVEDMTFLSDDLLWIDMINVQSPFVILNPIAGVGIGEPLEVSGTTNREEGYTIVVTAKGPVELTPATVPTTNRTFNATLDTTDARIGTYIVKADDGDGNSADAVVDIGGAQGVEEIKEKIGEAIDEKIDEKLPPEPTPESTPESTPEPTPEPEATPGFEGVFAIAGLLAIAYLVLKRRK